MNHKTLKSLSIRKIPIIFHMFNIIHLKVVEWFTANFYIPVPKKFGPTLNFKLNFIGRYKYKNVYKFIITWTSTRICPAVAWKKDPSKPLQFFLQSIYFQFNKQYNFLYELNFLFVLKMFFLDDIRNYGYLQSYALN